VIERKAGVAVERERRKNLLLAAVADHRELVVDGLISRGLEVAAEKTVDERRLARRERAENGDQRPPRDLHREGLVPIEQPEAVRHDVEVSETADDFEQIRVLALEVCGELVEVLLEAGWCGLGHLTSLRNERRPA